MNSPKYLAILQARLSSTRLPGKVVKPILGVPMLMRQIERIRRSEKISELLIATSTNPEDEAILELGRNAGIHVFPGSLNDVLDRFYQAAKTRMPENVVRLTGDCPIADPAVIDQIICFYEEGKYDYASNTLEPTYPDGLDAEVFRFSGLEKCWKEAELPSDREHVTPYFYKNPNLFRLGSFKDVVNRSNLRWTVDEPRDLELIREIYESCYPRNPAFTMEDVLRFLETRPDLSTLNSEFQRNEGYLKSLEKDREFLPQKENG